ncbi:hypothetical protein Y032_0025g1191 [Ancylostoma ceylanicum]|uniref:Uncharacterized protein n=1 Tax=Ancylostoma ceylanicum TaxID=53326 RepID=A0A016UWK5_9BILA|nr:hypothetical protein Y032_0025g1191 [Ancylostoma ceylanicum]
MKFRLGNLSVSIAFIPYSLLFIGSLVISRNQHLGTQIMTEESSRFAVVKDKQFVKSEDQAAEPSPAARINIEESGKEIQRKGRPDLAKAEMDEKSSWLGPAKNKNQGNDVNESNKIMPTNGQQPPAIEKSPSAPNNQLAFQNIEREAVDQAMATFIDEFAERMMAIETYFADDIVVVAENVANARYAFDSDQPGVFLSQSTSLI